METEMVKVPAERDLEVYRLVAVESRSTYAAAELFGISQTRVCQIIERVVDWMAAVLPKAAEGYSEGVRLQIAQQMSMARLDYLYGEAVAAWKASQDADDWSVQQRPTLDGLMVEVRRVKSHQGNIRYLAAATQICLQMAKVPAGMLPLVAMRHSPEVPLVAKRARKPAAPPNRDCSAEELPTSQETPVAAEAQIANNAAAASCEVPTEERPVATEPSLSVFDPVQLASLKEKAESLAPTKRRPRLNRKQRRAREQLLGRLRKAK